jgi:hypothetical protein
MVTELSRTSVNLLSCVRGSMTGFIASSFVQSLLITSNTALSQFTQFTVHRYTRTRILTRHRLTFYSSSTTNFPWLFPTYDGLHFYCRTLSQFQFSNLCCIPLYSTVSPFSWFYGTELLESKSKSNLCYDRGSVGQFVLVSSTHLGLKTFAGLLMLSALSNERTDLPFTIYRALSSALVIIDGVRIGNWIY